ncbi:F-box/LRR-repeat protein 7-like isoform X2 [Thrips palmi]|uniref:F-box/LRR-repeat protein 7-like isoform X2 n=1 Tax=Thrips palmi TaxID=161013 RepID=A0A6P8Y753_THRPL|nr:F-box/LRR-repeat protein 7-like isoform X2 [Thrips palmi]
MSDVDADHLEEAEVFPTIQDLPEELVIYILSFLSSSELCTCVAKVCTTWQDLAFTPSLWRSKDYLCRGDQKIEERDEIFHRAPCLRCLTIAPLGCADTSSLLSALKGRVLPVSELFLCGRRLGSEFYRDVSEHFEGVEKLVLQDVRLRQDDYSALGNLRSMTTVVISGDRVSWTGLQTLLSSCPDVSSLRIGVMGCDGDDELALVETLNSMSTKLTHCHFLGPLGLSDRVLQSLSNCTRLQELEINDCDEVSADGLLKGLMKLPSLEKLTLISLYNVPPSALNEFFTGMSLAKLHHLNIAVCRLLDNECLRTISERGCDLITDAGVAAVLDNCKKLHTLELWGLTNLTGESFRLYLPPSLPALNLIDFRYCSLVPQELLRKLEIKGRKILW